jgi:aminopeptidase N
MNRIIFAFTIALIASCGIKKDKSSSTVSSTSSVNEPTTDIELPAQRPVYRAAETILTDLIHTKLEVSFDWSKSRMNGIATITAKPHFYASDSVILDAKGMDILSVKLGEKNLTYTYTNDMLRIQLDREYTRHERYTITIAYVAKPDERETAGSAAITSDKGLYFINPTGEDPNKMPQIWTQGETESSSVWFPTIDSPNAKTTQEIFITVEDKYATLSNGKLISSKKNTNGTRTDHWKQELPHAPYLFMMGIGEFKVVEDSYTRPNGTKMAVNYYVEKEWEPYAKAIFGETPEMIRFFSKLLGYEYPWDKYHQIVVRDYVSGAMENTGAVIFGDYAYKTDRELLDENDQSTIAHELFHHWFGDLVTCESWSNLPLNESFANYSQYLWDEHRFGIDEADYQAEIEADGYYQSAQMSGYHDLIWYDYMDKEQMFDGHSYNKGGRILHMLRNYLGDEAFFEGMKHYLQSNQFKPAEFHQLRLSFEEVSGEDLNWFFDQWFLGSGHPILDFSQKVDLEKSTVTLTIKQKQNLELSPIFKLPMEIAVFDSNGKHVHKIVVEQLEQTIELPFNGTLNCVIFDNQQMLLAKVREEKTQEQYIFQFYNGERYRARRDALMNGTKGKGPQVQQLILDALNDPYWHIRQLAIEKAVKLEAENKTRGIAIIKGMADSDSVSKVRSSALTFLAANTPAADLESTLVNRITKDRSYLVVTNALRNLGKSNPDKAIELAKALENEKSSKMLSGIGQIYGSYAGKDAFPFFESSLKGNILQGFDQLSVMNSLSYFVSRQDAEVIDRSFALYSYLKSNGGYYTQMFLPQNISFLVDTFNDKITELKAQIEAHEKNKDAVYADQARKQKKAFEDLVVKFSPLLGE